MQIFEMYKPSNKLENSSIIKIILAVAWNVLTYVCKRNYNGNLLQAKKKKKNDGPLTLFAKKNGPFYEATKY